MIWLCKQMQSRIYFVASVLEIGRNLKFPV